MMMERLLPFYILPGNTGWKALTGWLGTAIGNAITLGIYAAGIAFGAKVVL